ncbi:sodium-coupled neutral amino acid transporter 7-like [Physella acuta]|uniref:sodium-coupled neutral amino acid transporter 7-like n=1 Tax=Physella acuta TaxID=109671 RepID=UPI0027DE8B12|nr:sodium-coupled neutral amino acid transporter 7-like [Physella acuta]
MPGSGWIRSAFLLVNATLGAGLLNFPMAYHQAGGVLTAMTVQSICVAVMVLTVFIMGYCATVKGSNTYQDVVLSLCGPKAQLACAVCILLHCFVFCISFLIIIGDQWELFFFKVAQDIYCTTHPIYMRRAFIISVTAVVLILPLCFTKRIDFLIYTSIAGVISSLYLAMLVTTKYFLPHDTPDTITTEPRSWVDIFLVLPNVCLGYDCHIEIIAIYSCMAKRNMREFSKTVTLALIVCIVFYTLTAALGYLQFGDDIANDILLSFKPTAEVMVAVVLVAVKVCTSYPIICYCGKTAFETVWRMFWKMSPEDMLYSEKTRRVITTLVWFTLTLISSVFVPNIGVAIQILGGLSAFCVFVFPGLCLLKLMQSRTETVEKQAMKHHILTGTAVVLVIVGVFLLGQISVQVIVKNIQGETTDSSRFTCS